jgi:hypothetical protein
MFLWILLTVDPVRHLPAAELEPAPQQAPAHAIDGHITPNRDVEHKTSLRPRIRDGLRWLARHQFDDGSWSARYFHQLCEGRCCDGLGDPSHDLAVTALASLAFISSGMADRKVGRIDFERATRRAVDWLAAQQDADGCFGKREGKFLYGHALATMAFARAYMHFGDPRYPRHIRAGIRFLENARNPSRAWRYGLRDGQNDTSVTGWAGMALLEAKDAGFGVPESAFGGIRLWLNEVTDRRSCSVSYSRRGGGPSYVRSVNEHYKRTEVLTAVALTLRLGMGDPPDLPILQTWRDRLRRDLPTWDTDGTCVDYYYWYYGLRALSLCRAEDDRTWSWWAGRVRHNLITHQDNFMSGCSWGSWDPVDKWGAEGGRVYATALNILTLSRLLPREN